MDQEFNYGVEFVLLISFTDSATGLAEDALASLQSLIMGFPSLVVQSTQGLFEPKIIYSLCCFFHICTSSSSFFLYSGNMKETSNFSFVLIMHYLWVSGQNFNVSKKEYTHAVVIRFRSCELLLLLLLFCIIQHLITYYIHSLDCFFWCIM